MNLSTVWATLKTWHSGAGIGILIAVGIYFVLSHLFSILILGAIAAYGYFHAGYLKTKLVQLETTAIENKIKSL